MYLVKDVEGYNGMIPYAFRHITASRKIAIFDSKDEAVKAVGMARKHDGADYLPLILETVIR